MAGDPELFAASERARGSDEMHVCRRVRERRGCGEPVVAGAWADECRIAMKIVCM